MSKLEEYKEDMIISKEHRKILQEFYEAIRIQDKNKAKKQIAKIKELPFLTHKKDVYVHLEDGGTVVSYQSRPWKARDLDRNELGMSEKNEKMHSYLAEFFDVAVRENMTRFGDWMLNDFKESASKGRTPSYDGNYEIAGWLRKYAETAVLFEEQGKKIIEPQTFREYPCLKEYMEHKIEYVKNEIEEKKVLNIAKEIYSSQDNEKHNENIQALVDILSNNLDNTSKYEKYSKILDLYNLKDEVCEKSVDLKLRLQKETIENLRNTIRENEQQLADREKIISSERNTSVNANEDFKGLTDAALKDKFEIRKKLMKKHPVMLEACLNSMCNAYVLTKDKTMKKEMLEDLYAIRKSGNSNAEKREMARTFGRVLERNPELAKDEALKGLAKIDYSAVGYTPTQVGFLKNHIKDKTK